MVHFFFDKFWTETFGDTRVSPKQRHNPSQVLRHKKRCLGLGLTKNRQTWVACRKEVSKSLIFQVLKTSTPPPLMLILPPINFIIHNIIDHVILKSHISGTQWNETISYLELAFTLGFQEKQCNISHLIKSNSYNSKY